MFVWKNLKNSEKKQEFRRNLTCPEWMSPKSRTVRLPAAKCHPCPRLPSLLRVSGFCWKEANRNPLIVRVSHLGSRFLAFFIYDPAFELLYLVTKWNLF